MGPPKSTGSGLSGFFPSAQPGLDHFQSSGFTTSSLRTGLPWMYSIIARITSGSMVFRSKPPPVGQKRILILLRCLTVMRSSQCGACCLVVSAHFPYSRRQSIVFLAHDPESTRHTRISHVQAMGDISNVHVLGYANRFCATAGAQV